MTKTVLNISAIRICFGFRISCFGFILLTATPLFAAQQQDRYFAVPLPSVPDKVTPAVQLTGNETPDQLAAAYRAAINTLLPRLANCEEQTPFTLEATVHRAGRPGAEAERLACCNALITALNAADTAPLVKLHLLRQLQVLGKAESVPILVKLLGNPNPHIASYARSALISNPDCPEQNRNKFTAEALAIDQKDLAIAGDRILQRAWQLYRNGDIYQAMQITHELPKEIQATTLKECGPRQVRFSLLHFALSSPDSIRLVASGAFACDPVESHRLFGRFVVDWLCGDDVAARAVALGVIKDLNADARKALVAASDKLPPAIKAIVIESVANLDDKSVLPLARASLKSSDPVLQSAGLTALARLDDPDADNVLIAAMKEATGEVKCNLIRVIAERGKHSAVPALLAVTNDSDANVVKAACRALGELADAGDVPVLLEKFPDVAAKALGRTAPDTGAELVQAALGRAKDKNKRTALMRMFRYCPGPKALTALQAALQDKDVFIREAAVRTLADWPDPVVMDTLVAVYQKPEKPAFGIVALRGIVRLAQTANKQPTPALVARYRQLLADARNDDDRRRVLGALGGCGDVAALELAVAQLATPNLRAEAEAAVKNIAVLVKKQHPKEAKTALRAVAAKH